MKTFDVVAVNLETNRVRFIATDKSERAAESIENMAVYRRGVETECFATVPHGTYQEGDQYNPKDSL